MKVWAAGEGVRSGKEAAWDMNDLEIEVRTIEQPPCLAAVEVLCLTEVRQVLVVCESLDGERGAMEVMPPRFQSADDCEEFVVVDVVVPFCRNERL